MPLTPEQRERETLADSVCSAILECIHTLDIVHVLASAPFDPMPVPFADDVADALDGIQPLRPLMTYLMYGEELLLPPFTRDDLDQVLAESPPTRREQADAVCGAILKCLHALALLEAAADARPGSVPFDDNVRQALGRAKPLRPTMLRLLYGDTLPGSADQVSDMLLKLAYGDPLPERVVRWLADNPAVEEKPTG